MIKDYFKMALQSFAHRQVRSWLTMIGIFIGITALIAVISLGQGLEASVVEQFNELGSDKLWIQPGTSTFGGSSSAANLTDRDKKVVDGTLGVEKSMGWSFQNAKIEYKDEETFSLVTGYSLREDDGLWDEMFGGNLQEGRWHDNGDTFKVVLGYDFTQDDKIFPRGLKLFDQVMINNFTFKVIGFYEKVGNSADDSNIFIIEDAYERLFGDKLEDDYKLIIAKSSPGVNPNELAENLKKNLRNDRNLDEGDEDFSIQSTEELVESFNAILQIVQVVIAGIAAISLIVGGVGIMNTMYTAVLERTQEIGIMKAIGARNSDILIIFLIESGILGLVGGGIGVISGLGLAKVTEYVGTVVLGTNMLQAWWSWQLIFGALLFTFVVGVLSGVLPARQASMQQAVDSLRYE